MDVSKTAVRLTELSKTCLGVSCDLGLLAGDAGGCPLFDVGADGVPYVFSFDELDLFLVKELISFSFFQ